MNSQQDPALKCHCACGLEKPSASGFTAEWELKEFNRELLQAARKVLGARFLLGWGRREMKARFAKAFDELETVVSKARGRL